MGTTEKSRLEETYPRCRAALGAAWERAAEACAERGPEDFPALLEELAGPLGAGGFLPDLARLELAAAEAGGGDIPPGVEEREVNPTLRVLGLGWKGLAALWEGGGEPPSRGQETVLVFRHPKTGEVEVRAARPEDLIALKMVVEGISPGQAAAEAGLRPAALEGVLGAGAEGGVILAPRTRIRRDPDFPAGEGIDERFFEAGVFTLQWHVTQACDLHCKHCYDRSDRGHLPFERALGVLEDFRGFLDERRVRGQVSFSGGNPLLYPRFAELYRAASDLGLDTAIVGNPCPRERVEELMEIQAPAFYQVSLEGLEEHDDAIRGAGHFGRTMGFLEDLRDLGVYSMVMLTLTRDNMGQVLPLAEALRGRVDRFTFNRLALVGEGANLALPEKEDFALFLEQYMEAAGRNPAMGLKDNLFNILLRRRGQGPSGGCTGFGCGAAFNFMAVLPDGEVHACRKFPSPIGNVFRQGLAHIYDSEAARRYRSGARACRRCPIRPVCGGCLSVIHSFGLDVGEDRDPFCFMEG
ncbi:MAG: thio(seleno)oxazole modification radical SAM maturase SbtM [Thermodesulfovibrionales bacterium]